MDLLKREMSQVRSAHGDELTTLQGQVLAAQHDKRAAEDKLAREMEAIQQTLNSMQHQGKNEEIWKGRCFSMKAEMDALSSERDSLAQQLQAQRQTFNAPVPPPNHQRPRPALAISTAANHPTNTMYQSSKSNGRMY
jgi:hypothetical protein